MDVFPINNTQRRLYPPFGLANIIAISMIMKYSGNVFFRRVTEVIWTKTLRQSGVHLSDSYIHKRRKHDFNQELAHRLYVTRAIFSMAGHGNTYFQSSTFRWDLHKLAMLLTWRRRRLLLKKIEHIMRYTTTKKKGCNEWIIAIECGQNIKVTERSGKNND